MCVNILSADIIAVRLQLCNHWCDNLFSLSELEDMEYRKVIVRGKFDHSKELYLMPRPLLESGSSTSGRFGRSPPKSGANVITAFEVASNQHPKCVTYTLLDFVFI